MWLLLSFNNSVNVEMPLLLLLLLVLPLCVSAKQALLEETVNDDVDETMYKSEKLDNIGDNIEELEEKLETKNVEVENLQTQLKEVKVQFAEIERKIEEVMLSTQNKDQNQEIARVKKQVADLEIKGDQGASLKSEMRAEVKKQVDKVLETLLRWMLAREPEDRPDMPAVIGRDWCRKRFPRLAS